MTRSFIPDQFVDSTNGPLVASSGATAITASRLNKLGAQYQAILTDINDPTSELGTALAAIIQNALSHPGNATLSGLAKEPWYGGPSYYTPWSRAAAKGMTSASFFPFAVFFGRPSDQHPQVLHDAGVNVFMGAERTTSDLSLLTTYDIRMFAQSEWTTAELATAPAQVVAYQLGDEIEMDESFGNDAGRLAHLKSVAATARALNDGRFVQTNFGNGVLGTYWAPGTMDQYAKAVDLESVDKYAYTSPDVRFEIRRSPYWPNIAKPIDKGGSPIGADADAKNAWSYWWLTKMMRLWNGNTVPTWSFIETAKPYVTEAGASTITPAQIEGAAWASIIGGASGIAWFQHNNDSVNGNYSIVDSPDASGIRAKLADLSARVKALAPVINSQTNVYSFGSDKITMLKSPGDGYAYIFAMLAPTITPSGNPSTTDTFGGITPGTRSFTLPPGITGTTVQVVNESRTISVVGGAFSDNFAAENTCHIYKIAI